MKRASVFAIPLASIVLLVGAVGVAQKQTDKTRQQKPQAEQEKVTQIGILKVRLPVTVKVKDGFVKGLTRANFEVYEDGKKQKIEEFLSPAKLPLRVGVLMDTSNSVKLKLPLEKDAAEDFISTIISIVRKDKALLANFDSEVSLQQDFTDNQELLIRAVRKLKAGGYTKLYDGIYRVIEEKMSNIDDSDARRVIVVLSDGEDTASEHSLQEAIALAQQYDVTIFGISTKNFTGIDAGTTDSSDDKKLRELCEATGGQTFLPSQKLELFRAFSQVARDLRQEYVIFYEPLNQDKTGKKREIKVKLVSADGRLHYKQGYAY